MASSSGSSGLQKQSPFISGRGLSRSLRSDCGPRSVIRFSVGRLSLVSFGFFPRSRHQYFPSGSTAEMVDRTIFHDLYVHLQLVSLDVPISRLIFRRVRLLGFPTKNHLSWRGEVRFLSVCVCVCVSILFLESSAPVSDISVRVGRGSTGFTGFPNPEIQVQSGLVAFFFNFDRNVFPSQTNWQSAFEWDFGALLEPLNSTPIKLTELVGM